MTWELSDLVRGLAQSPQPLFLARSPSLTRHATTANGARQLRHHAQMISALLVCMVIGIHDGDSLLARCGPPGDMRERELRVHGIDAPERYQSFSDTSRSSLAALCLNVPAHIRPIETDRYGRSIAQVECRGRDVARHQVTRGMAWVYTRYADTRPDLPPLQAQARKSHAGLWADSDPVPPWQWRHAQAHAR
ncbi:thermonuclease family protein [Comamonas antarctica]|uniref:thermonuclease family protein n=1 Tax=Comamonas antarctica TaxID=2743470 RepID=UPI0028E5A6BC|nr:thermonuclease family protein [Comamonas antarctica]